MQAGESESTCGTCDRAHTLPGPALSRRLSYSSHNAPDSSPLSRLVPPTPGPSAALYASPPAGLVVLWNGGRRGVRPRQEGRDNRKTARDLPALPPAFFCHLQLTMRPALNLRLD